jgi:hypothetical protein
MEYFSYLVNLITKDVRCTQESTSRIVKEKAVFNKKKAIFTSKYDKFKHETTNILNFREQLCMVLLFGHFWKYINNT